MRYLTSKEAAETIGVTVSTIRRLIDSGALEASDIGTQRPRYRITDEALNSYMNSRRVQTAS
jgi:excisionase family DNA binding protein